MLGGVLDNKCPLLKKLSNSICDAMNIGLHKPILDNCVRNQAIIIQNLEIFGQFSGGSGQNCPKRLLLQVKIDSQERRLDNFMKYCRKLSKLPPMQPVYEEFLSANRKR